MPGPNWSDDDPTDGRRIVANVSEVLGDVSQLAATRAIPAEADLRRWHSIVYGGCAVPSPAYVGRFRGERHPDVADYEVGVGPTMPDGFPDRVGVWAADVAGAAAVFFGSLTSALTTLDSVIPAGARPSRVDVLHEVVGVTAVVHGEWVRIHPFVNGNGRMARLLAAHISLRYGLPIYVTLKPRPHDVAYARASRQSMGRPPSFAGDHAEATAVFVHLLALQLLGP
ncbi:MAG: Fic family protein [Acidimicrobiales bacterium]